MFVVISHIKNNPRAGTERAPFCSPARSVHRSTWWPDGHAPHGYDDCGWQVRPGDRLPKCRRQCRRPSPGGARACAHCEPVRPGWGPAVRLVRRAGGRYSSLSIYFLFISLFFSARRWDCCKAELFLSRCFGITVLRRSPPNADPGAPPVAGALGFEATGWRFRYRAHIVVAFKAGIKINTNFPIAPKRRDLEGNLSFQVVRGFSSELRSRRRAEAATRGRRATGLFPSGGVSARQCVS